MSLQVAVQYALPRRGVPSPVVLRRWARAALAGRRRRGQVVIRVVDAREGARLNAAYRQRSGPTNVLSFPGTALPRIVPSLLGDVVICAPVVAREARAQGKDPRAHWAHLVVHGVLHLLGYDHHTRVQTRRMESLEKKILARLGYPDPYRSPL